MKISTTASQFLGNIHFLLLILLLAACNRNPKDDGTTPAPLFPQPQMVEASPEGGYAINQVTGDSIQPIILSNGDTLKTGVPIPAKGKLIHPDSVAKPQSFVVDHAALTTINAHPNRHKIPENIPTFPVDHSQLKTVKFGEGKQDYVLINSTGDTIPTGVPISAKGKEVKAIQPIPTKALPPAFKDAAIVNLQYLDVDHGMNSFIVMAIIEDRSGNLWFGTWGGGVSRYDGVSFKHYTEKEGLSHNSVHSIIEDRSGNIWFGTFGGVSRYDGVSFKHYTEKEGLSNNHVTSILEDKSGNLWFGTERGGVSKLTLSGAEGYDGAIFKHYTEKEGLSHNHVTSIIEDRSGNLWFGTGRGGVSRYDGVSFKHYTKKEGLGSNGVLSIVEDHSGNIWFGTWGGGVSKLALSGAEGYDGVSFTHYTEKEGLSNNYVLSILEDQSGNLWFGTERGGVSKLSLSGAEGYDGAIFKHYTEKEGLSHNHVSSIIEDRSGNIWFGTSGGGVSRYDGATFEHYTEKQGLSNKNVSSIIEDHSGNLWFGTERGGMSKLTLSGAEGYDGASFKHYTEKEGLSNNSVFSILKDRSENLWFGTFGDGVSRYDGVSSEYYTEKEGLSNNYVFSILEDRSGNIWFGTWGGGVSRYDGVSFKHFTEKEGLSNNIVFSILEDRSGNIWFGTSGGGVSRYDGVNFKHYTEKEGLSNNYVWSILEDRSGNIWFGTWGGGVSRYDGVSFKHFTEKQGLISNIVWSILEDKSGNLFIATEKGLTKLSIVGGDIEKITFSINVLTKQDGLKGLDFSYNSAYIDSKNRAWWGIGKNLTMLDLNNFKTSTQIPQPFLKQLDINEQFIDYRNISDSLGNEISFISVQKFENYPLNLELPYHKNHLTFHFAAIDWKARHKIHYSHRMLGLNDNWSNPTREAKADYRNLPYGTYTFQIRAIGESGVWSEPFEYTFTINPPWGHTWWAYLIYVLLFLLALRIFSKWRERKLELEKVKLEQTVEERTKELKASQAQLIQSEKMASLGELTAGIAHEIQNPLNFVNNFSELNTELIDELSAEVDNGNLEEVKILAKDIRENEQKINHHGKRADSIVKGMLAHSRSSTGEKVLTDINALADEYLRLSYHGLRAKDKSFNATFETDFDSDLPKINVVPQDIGMVLLNLINNAFQAVHERSGKEEEDFKPEVIVSTKTLGDKVEISVKDNGSGIPSHIKDKIFQPFFTTKPTGQGTGLGLSLAYDIIQAHGGELQFTTKEGEDLPAAETGTKFKIQLPIS